MTVQHEFGGEWTERKLELVSYYLRFYTTALKGKDSWKPELWYIDAFAGSGERTALMEEGGLLEGRPIENKAVQLDGSARRAMAIQPPFSKLVFIEEDNARFQALKALEAQDGRVECLRGDANEILPSIFNRQEWRRPSGGLGRMRGVVFLDPYGMQVRWSVLEALAATKRVDVWYLFPTEAVLRQLAHDLNAVDHHKQAKLDDVLGTSEWRKDLYEERIEGGLFGEAMALHRRKNVTRREVEAYFSERARAVFPYISPAIPLGDREQFSLFMLMANDSPRAIGLATKLMASLIKQQAATASRRMSSL